MGALVTGILRKNVMYKIFIIDNWKNLVNPQDLIPNEIPNVVWVVKVCDSQPMRFVTEM